LENNESCGAQPAKSRQAKTDVIAVAIPEHGCFRVWLASLSDQQKANFNTIGRMVAKNPRAAVVETGAR